MNKYETIGVIGEGAYGIVLKCRHKDTSDIVAIKKFKNLGDQELINKTALREVKVLRILKHPNIVGLKESFQKRGRLHIVFEFMECNMLEYLECYPQGIDPYLVKFFISQLVKAIDYCHQNHILHRDIKPENLLVNQGYIVKLCDFGFARLASKVGNDYTSYVATRWYRAPELLIGSSTYDKSMDVWSIACVLYELIEARPLFPGESEIDQLYIMQKTLGPLLPQHREYVTDNPRFYGFRFPELGQGDGLEARTSSRVPNLAIRFMKSILYMDPSRRATAKECLSHPYFDGIANFEQSRVATPYIYIESKPKKLPKNPDETGENPSSNHLSPKKQDKTGTDSDTFNTGSDKQRTSPKSHHQKRNPRRKSQANGDEIATKDIINTDKSGNNPTNSSDNEETAKLDDRKSREPTRQHRSPKQKQKSHQNHPELPRLNQSSPTLSNPFNLPLLSFELSTEKESHAHQAYQDISDHQNGSNPRKVAMMASNEVFPINHNREFHYRMIDHKPPSQIPQRSYIQGLSVSVEGSAQAKPGSPKKQNAKQTIKSKNTDMQSLKEAHQLTPFTYSNDDSLAKRDDAMLQPNELDCANLNSQHHKTTALLRCVHPIRGVPPNLIANSRRIKSSARLEPFPHAAGFHPVVRGHQQPNSTSPLAGIGRINRSFVMDPVQPIHTESDPLGTFMPDSLLPDATHD